MFDCQAGLKSECCCVLGGVKSPKNKMTAVLISSVWLVFVQMQFGNDSCFFSSAIGEPI